MCWNEEISFMTSLMSTVIALYIKKRNGIDDAWCGNFLLSIAGMQYIEFFAWIIIKHNNYNTNLYLKIVNKLLALCAIPILLAIQPFISYYGAMKNKYISKGYFLYYYIFYSITTFIYFLTNRKKNYISKVQNSNKTMFNEGYYLDWGHRENHPLISLIHVSTLFYPFTYRLAETYVKRMLASGFLTAFVFSHSASRWCLYTNIWSIIFLFKKI